MDFWQREFSLLTSLNYITIIPCLNLVLVTACKGLQLLVAIVATHASSYNATNATMEQLKANQFLSDSFWDGTAWVNRNLETARKEVSPPPPCTTGACPFNAHNNVLACSHHAICTVYSGVGSEDHLGLEPDSPPSSDKSWIQNACVSVIRKASLLQHRANIYF
eukprot:gene519-630_t